MYLFENGYLFMNLVYVYALQISRDIDCFHLLH